MNMLMDWGGFLYRRECDGFCGTCAILAFLAAGAHESMRIADTCDTSLDYQPEA